MIDSLATFHNDSLQHSQYITMLNSIAVVNFRTGKYDEAMAIYDKALTYLEKITEDGKETSFSNKYMSIYNKIGGVYIQLEEYERAEIHTIPFYVHGMEGNAKVDVSWNAPNSGIEEDFNYHVNRNQGYANEPYENVWLGNIYQTEEKGTIETVDIHFGDCLVPGPESVTLDILDIDGNVLVSSAPFQTALDTWMSIDIPNIAFDGDFYAMVHWKDNENTSHFLSCEIETVDEDLGYIKYSGTPPTLVSGLIGYTCIFEMVVNVTIEGEEATRAVESYNIYRGLFDEISEASTWTALNNDPITDLTYIDENWPPAEVDNYVYAVEAILTTGTSEMSFSNPVSNVAPEFISTPITQTLVSIEYVYDVEVVDGNLNDDIMITGDVIPDWATLTDNGDGTATLMGTPMDIGTYDVVLKASDGMLETLQEFSIQADPVGIDESDAFAELRIYPNPVREQLNIEWNGEVDVSIYSAVGKLIGTYKITGDLTTIDVSDLAKGIYSIRFTDGDQIATSKFSKF